MSGRLAIRQGLVAQLVAAGLNARDTSTEASPQSDIPRIDVLPRSQQNEQRGTKEIHRRNYLLDIEVITRAADGPSSMASNDVLSRQMENALFANPTFGIVPSIVERIELRDVVFEVSQQSEGTITRATHTVYISYFTDDRPEDTTSVPLAITDVEYGDPSIRDVIDYTE